MTNHNAVTNWPHDGKHYENGWFIGSEGDEGEHIQDASGWPYSVYRKANEIGGCDVVLCHGIQNIDDALKIACLLTDQGR